MWPDWAKSQRLGWVGTMASVLPLCPPSGFSCERAWRNQILTPAREKTIREPMQLPCFTDIVLLFTNHVWGNLPTELENTVFQNSRPWRLQFIVQISPPTPGTLLFTISFSFLNFTTICIFSPLDTKLYEGRDFNYFVYHYVPFV